MYEGFKGKWEAQKRLFVGYILGRFSNWAMEGFKSYEKLYTPNNMKKLTSPP